MIPAALVVAALATSASTGNPAGDPRGEAAVRAAIDALGGAGRIAGHDRWLAVGVGRENTSAELQGLAPDAATWRDHEERIAIGRGLATAAWERRTPRNDSSLRWRRFVYGDGWTGVVDWVAQAARRREGATNREQRARLARRFPHLLLLEAASADPRWLGEGRSGSQATDLVSVHLGGGPKLTLVIEREPARLVGIEYPMELPGRGEVTVSWRWPRWRPDAALAWVPTGHRIVVDGQPFQEVDYTRYQIDQPGADSLLGTAVVFPARPAQREAAPPPAELPAHGEIAPGIHVLEVEGFKVMVAELDDRLLLFEAPEAHPGLEGIPAAAAPRTAVGPLLRAAVNRIAAGRPIGFVVLSHHHDDHLGGLAAVVDSGTTILVASGHDDAARTALAPGVSTRPGRAPTIETVSERRIIAGKTRTIEVLEVGPNPHTDANLFVWLPAERIAFQGDLFYYDEHAPFPPSGRERMNRFFASWLAARGIEPRAVYGVHSDGAAGPAALARARGADPE